MTTASLVNVKKYQSKTLKHDDGRPMKSYYCIEFYQELYGDKFVYIGRKVKPPSFYVENGEKYIYTHRLQNPAEAAKEVIIPESKWHNPFHIGKDGTREEVIEKFADYLRWKPELLDSICELKDKILGCYCHPLRCHGNVLIDILNGNSEKYGIRMGSIRML